MEGDEGRAIETVASLTRACRRSERDGYSAREVAAVKGVTLIESG